jgi:phage tail protein
MPRLDFERRWETDASGAPVTRHFQNTGGPLLALFEWGPLQFEVSPLNIHEYDHTTDTDWARKEIAGAPIYREWVGENDEIVCMRGRIFPHRIGGLSELEILEAMRAAGLANLLQRGDGYVLGWFVMERLSRAHAFLGADGVGQQINFEAQFARVPTPDPARYFSALYQIIS